MKNKIMASIVIIVVFIFMASLIAGYKQLYEEEKYKKQKIEIVRGFSPSFFFV